MCKKYRIDYGTQKSFFKNAKDRYRAGKDVELYFDLIATDTVYDFYLDDGQLNVGYDESKGIIIKFTMPPKDVSLRFVQKNISLEDTEK